MTSNTPDRTNRNRSSPSWYVLFAVLHLAILVYYWFEWRTVQGFVEAVDHNSRFMRDFEGYYYPMSRQILQVPTPLVGYYYSSFFALLLAPIGSLTLPHAIVVWTAIQVACMVALWVVSGRGVFEFRPRGMVLYSALCATSYPILNNFKWGQVSVLTTLGMAGAVVASNRRKGALAGILLAFAAAIKFYPALFIGYFGVKRDVRTCVSFALAAAVLYMAFPAAVLGPVRWLQFETTVLSTISNSALGRDASNSQYIVHVGLRWWTIASGRVAGDGEAALLSMVGYGVGVASVAIAWVLQRTPSPENQRLSMAAMFLLVPFVVKTSWPHYFAYLPLCQAAVVCASLRASARGGKVLMALGVASMSLSSVFVFNLFAGWSSYNSAGMLFISNLLLLCAVYVVAIPLVRDSFVHRSETPASGLTTSVAT